jgi:DNA anti-recombination protein RmuC
MASQMRELAEASRTASDSLRSTLDARIKELRDGNDKKLADIRAELAAGLKNGTESVTAILGQMGDAQRTLLGELTKQVKGLTDSNQETLERIRTTLDRRIRELQEGNDKKLADIRLEMDTGLKANSEALVAALQRIDTAQQGKLDGMTQQLKELADTNKDSLDRVRGILDSRVKELHSIQQAPPSSGRSMGGSARRSKGFGSAGLQRPVDPGDGLSVTSHSLVVPTGLNAAYSRGGPSYDCRTEGSYLALSDHIFKFQTSVPESVS